MYRTGLWLFSAGFWLAMLGVFFSEPAARIPDLPNLFAFALGLEVKMFRVPGEPGRYLVHVVAADWLLGCLALIVVGAVLMGLARRRQQRKSSPP